MSSCIPFNQVDVQNIVFKPTRTTEYGAKFIPIKDAFNNLLRFYSPKCKAPFGLKSKTLVHGKTINYVELSAQPHFETKLREIDAHVLDYVKQNSEFIFTDKIDAEDIDDMFFKSVKDSKNAKYLPLFKATLSQSCTYYNNQNKQIPPPPDKFTAEYILECNGVYFGKKNFYLSWNVMQVRVATPEKITGYAFIDDDD